MRWHGLIASAYVQTAKDIFLRTKLANACGLLPKQVDYGHCSGFPEERGSESRTNNPRSTLLTGVAIYLKIVAGEISLDEDVFRKHWFKSMHRNVSTNRSGHQSDEFDAEMALELLRTPN